MASFGYRRTKPRGRNPHCHMKNESPRTDLPHPIRAYDPSWHKLYNGRVSDLVGVCPHCNENKVKMTRCDCPDGRDFDGNAPVISIDGACRDNGKFTARGSIGVFYGPGAKKNYCRMLSPALPQTNQVAELVAAISMLEDVMTWSGPWIEGSTGEETCKVLVLTDSTYLVKAISEHIWKWKTNGFRNAKGQPVANQELWQKLDQLMRNFEANNIRVWFWHVMREFNKDADRLANEAFDQY